jgi:hypothetical protein
MTELENRVRLAIYARFVDEGQPPLFTKLGLTGSFWTLG